jgi:hypothetical protein
LNISSGTTTHSKPGSQTTSSQEVGVVGGVTVVGVSVGSVAGVSV